MNHRKTIITSITVVSAAAGGAAVMQRYYNDLYTRFPHLDKRLMRKAYRRFLWTALTGDINMQNLTDTQMDELFLDEYDAVLMNI